MKKENQKLVLIKKMFEEGYTSLMIAKKLGINPKSMYYYIKKYSLIQKNKQRIVHCNDSYFNNIDSEEKAYLLGFFLADGYVSEKRRICLNNSIDDISFLELFQKEVCKDSKIIILNKQLGAKFRKPQCVLRISSQEMYDTLVYKYDIKPNKTQDKTFKFNFDLIPRELHRHFIRGFFDGDGSISFDLKGNSFNFNFSFVMTSVLFTNQIGLIFENTFDIKSRVREQQGKTTNWFTLAFSYNRNVYPKIKLIYEYFYKDSNHFLERKKIKFEKYLEYRANAIDNTIAQCNA